MTSDLTRALLAIVLLFSGIDAALAASVSVVPNGSGVFAINGEKLDNIAGIDLTIGYDPSILSNPSVVQGPLVSGAMMAANTNIASSVKIAIISTRPFSGSGTVATLSFASHNGTGGISSATVKMINSKGATVASQAFVIAPDSDTTTTTASSSGQTIETSSSRQTTETSSTGTQTVSPPYSPQSGGTSTPTAATGITATLGTITMPADTSTSTPRRNESRTLPQPAAPPPPAETAEIIWHPESPQTEKPVEKAVQEPSPKSVAVKMASYKGVLDKFRTYTGEKTPAALTALFNSEPLQHIRQEPAIVLSDGKTPLKISLKVETTGDKSPNFAFSGARLLSLNRDAESNWLIEAMPKSGGIHAGVTILTEGDVIEHQLNIAPSVATVSIAEADFILFLKDIGAAKPKYDLNGDGRHDYIDDYIYTANYLTIKSAPPVQPGK